MASASALDAFPLVKVVDETFTRYLFMSSGDEVPWYVRHSKALAAADHVKVFLRSFHITLRGCLFVGQLTELKERCAKLENQCRAKHAAGELNKALNNFNDKYNSVRCFFELLILRLSDLMASS